MTYIRDDPDWIDMAEQNTFDSAYLKSLRELRPMSYRIRKTWVTIFCASTAPKQVSKQEEVEQ